VPKYTLKDAGTGTLYGKKTAIVDDIELFESTKEIPQEPVELSKDQVERLKAAGVKLDEHGKSGDDDPKHNRP
jgi:hypothetical protein